MACEGKRWLGSGPGQESWRSCPLGFTFKTDDEIYEIPNWFCAADDHKERSDRVTGEVFTGFSGNCQSCEGIQTKEGYTFYSRIITKQLCTRLFDKSTEISSTVCFLECFLSFECKL